MDIKRAGKCRAIVYLEKLDEANDIIRSIELKKMFHVYVPEHFIAVKGVLTGIPTDMTIDKIQNEIQSDYEILSMYRLNKVVNENKKPTDRIVVSWRSDTLPKYVKLCYVRSRVELFIRKTIICENCQKFNHLTKNCRGKKRCNNCSKINCESITNMKQCDNEAFCLCCKHKHQTSDKQKCKEWEMQNKIKIITATKPLSYKEVRNEIDFFTENKFDVFNRTEDSVKVFETFAERYDLPL